MKRKLKWTAVVLAVLLLGFATALFLWPRDRITAESWKQIRVGMSEKEVENILGSSGLSWDDKQDAIAKNTGNHIINGVSLSEPNLRSYERCYWKFWLGRRGIISIAFDQQHVVQKEFTGWRPTNPMDRLRDWLGW
jgi:hypothetical protein